MLAKNSTCVYPQYSTNYNTDSDKNDPSKSNVYKFNGDIVYECLLTPNIPFELDYVRYYCHHLYYYYHYNYRQLK